MEHGGTTTTTRLGSDEGVVGGECCCGDEQNAALPNGGGAAKVGQEDGGSFVVRGTTNQRLLWCGNLRVVVAAFIVAWLVAVERAALKGFQGFRCCNGGGAVNVRGIQQKRRRRHEAKTCKGVGELHHECVKDHCEEREYMWNVSPQRRVRKL